MNINLERSRNLKGLGPETPPLSAYSVPQRSCALFNFIFSFINTIGYIFLNI